MRKILILKLAALAAIGALALPLGACNTFEGIGEDISALGRGLSRGASSTRENIEKKN